MKPAFDISPLTARTIKQTSLVQQVLCKSLTRWSVKDNKELFVFHLGNYLKSTMVLLTYLSSRCASHKTKVGLKTFEIQQFKWSKPAFCHYFCCWPVRSYLAAKICSMTCIMRTKTSKLLTRVRLLLRFLFCASSFPFPPSMWTAGQEY